MAEKAEKSGPDTERDFSPAEIVRMFEASCKIDYPTETERAFRMALMKMIAKRIGLKEYRDASISAPGQPRAAQRPAKA